MRVELLLLGLGVLAVGWLRKQAEKDAEGRADDQRGTWRAGSRRSSNGSESTNDSGSVRFNDRTATEGPDGNGRDAFTGEPLRAAARIFQCVGCKSYYHEESVTLLRRENGGRCVSCKSREIVRDKIAEQSIADAADNDRGSR